MKMILQQKMGIILAHNLFLIGHFARTKQFVYAKAKKL